MIRKKERLLCGILALLGFAMLFAVSGRAGVFDTGAQAETQTYDVVVLGDSIFGHTTDETSIVALMEEEISKSCLNAALGGTCAGRNAENLEQRQIKDALSLVSISKALVSGDFRMQQLVNLKENGTGHFPKLLEELKRVDLSETELLLIGHGVNDYHAGILVDNEEDVYDEYTYGGALRSAVRTLQNAYPDLRIVLVTPPYTWYPEVGLTCEEYVIGGNVLEDYVNAELAIAQELGVEIIDMYHGVFRHDTWEDWQQYSVDGLHPNEEGRRLLAQIIIDYLGE